MKIVVGEGSCGIAAGAAKVYDKLASALDKSNELTITGCIGMCFLEPIVDIYDNGTLTRLVKVSENDCERIAKAVNSDDLSTSPVLPASEWHIPCTPMPPFSQIAWFFSAFASPPCMRNPYQ